MKMYQVKEKEGLLKSAWLMVHEDVYNELIALESNELELYSGVACSTMGFGGEPKWIFLYGIKISYSKDVIGYPIYNNIPAASDPENIFFIKRES